MSTSEFKENDVVVKVGTAGIRGVIKEIKYEITGTQGSKEKGQMISVEWDNGTISYLAPEALEHFREKNS